jgi:enolase
MTRSATGSQIADVRAWEVLDSRGRPTVAARVELADGTFASAAVPSGASAGSHEAFELRDGGTRYGGRGVLTAVGNVTSVLRDAVIGSDVEATGEVDARLRLADSTPNFEVVGANATLAVSLAATRAAAARNGVTLARWLAGDRRLRLPMPMVNIISGGAHAANAIDVQDFLAVPLAATTFAQAIEWCAAIRDATTTVALARGYSSAALAADEGGVGVTLDSNRAALELLTAGIEVAGFEPGRQIGIAIDVAATEFYRDGRYRFARENRDFDSAELISEISNWVSDFPIVSIEDIVAEDDWDGWLAATALLGDRIQLVGDDLFVTNPERLVRGIELGVANSVLTKVNQNGLLSGAKHVVDLATRAGYSVVVSARSGETEDSWLSDLAVGWNAEQIKVGSTHRSERGAKWNRLLEFEALEDTTFAGPWSLSSTGTLTKGENIVTI